MRYLWILWSGLILYFVLAVLIILFFALQRDRYTAPDTIFNKQRWNLYDVLICVLLLHFSFFIVVFLSQWFLLQTVIFLTLNTFSFYIVFKLRLRQSFSVLGLLKRGIFRDVLYGLKIILIFKLFFYGSLFLSLISKKFLGQVQIADAYKGWFFYQDNLLVIAILVSIYILIGPFLDELIFRGLMYSPFRRKAGKWGAIFLTSIVFALYHHQLFDLIGVFFVYVYEKRQSLIASIAAHVFYNLTSVITFMYTSDFLRLGYEVNYRSYVGIMFLIFLSVFLLILFIGTEQEKVVVAERSSGA